MRRRPSVRVQVLRDLMPLPEAAARYVSQNAADKTWTCPTCGVISPLVLASGWYVRRKCSCERQAEEAELAEVIRRSVQQAQVALTYTWLGTAWTETALSGKTFATFQREWQAHAYDLAQSYARHSQGVLALYGSYGTGKTHLLAAIANHLRAEGKPCLFASVVTLFDAMQDRIQQNQDYHALIKQGVQTPLLLLDDLDKLKPSEFREEVLYKLINGRNNAGRPLAISSNSTPDELQRWIGKAGRSRLMQDLIPVQMNGPDYRLERSHFR